MGQRLEPVGELAGAAAPPKRNGSIEGLVIEDVGPIEQRRLPLPRHLAQPLGESDFAHPAEVELARIFTFYRVRWVYEPTTFHLEVDDQGRPLEQVTPDFYLPDHDVYVELTTMRQSLVTRKNRKIRRLKEAFPTLQVRLIYRKDFDRLVESFLPSVASGAAATPGKPVFSENQIQQRVYALACEMIAVMGAPSGPPPSWGNTTRAPRSRPRINVGEVGANYGNGHFTSTGAPAPMLIGLGSGSRRFLDSLEAAMRSAGAEVESDWLSLTRFGETGSDRRVRIGRRPRRSFQGKEVTLVADVVSTGLSAAFAIQWLKRHGAASVRVCTLLDREDARILDVPIAHAGFRAPNDMLVGYGIPFKSRFDELPHIAALKTPVTSKAPAQRPE